jgi:hypothetical protein
MYTVLCVCRVYAHTHICCARLGPKFPYPSSNMLTHEGSGKSLRRGTEQIDFGAV